MANNILDDTEQRLLVSTQHGNHEAFGKLYDKYAPMVMGFVTNLGCDKKTAEEVAATVLNIPLGSLIEKVKIAVRQLKESAIL